MVPFLAWGGYGGELESLLPLESSRRVEVVNQGHPEELIYLARAVRDLYDACVRVSGWWTIKCPLVLMRREKGYGLRYPPLSPPYQSGLNMLIHNIRFILGCTYLVLFCIWVSCTIKITCGSRNFHNITMMSQGTTWGSENWTRGFILPGSARAGLL